MYHPIETSNLCERCKLIRFDDAAAGCREVVDEEGTARLSFDDAEVEWQEGWSGTFKFGLIKLDWHLDDNLPGMPQLSASSQAGCDFCDSLRLGLKTGLAELPEVYDVRDVPLGLTAYLELGEQGVKGLMMEGVYNHDQGAGETVNVHFGIEASPGCQKWLGAKPYRHSDYIAPENASQMRRILAECTANCHPWKASSILPTRLIDVGTSSQDTPRLVISSEDLVSTEIKYAALSYCWGDEEDATTQLKTEIATLEQRCEGIPCDTMTPAIRDAVELTRAIGLRYIWIDALCIVQDDPAEWSHESGQMDHVYHGAFVTFCGLNSTSCHKSLLKRAPTVTIPFQSTLLPTVDGYLLVRLQPFPTSRYGWVGKNFHLDYLESKWSRRAWTLQEEQLSNRRLLFGGLKMHFQCGTHTWSEGEDKLYPQHEFDIGLYDRITGIKQHKFPVSSLYEMWRNICGLYSHRSLTNNLDRLPAISGLARLVGETLGDHYLAGFWKGDILTRLSWQILVPSSYGLQHHVQNIREREYIAPSWSWAACPGGVLSSTHVDGCQIFQECTLLDVHVETDQQNTFGRVYSGYLRIRGKVAPVPTSWREAAMKNGWSNFWFFDPGEDQLQDGCITGDSDWYQGGNMEGLENLVMLLLHYQQPAESAASDNLNDTDTTEQRILTALMLYPTGNLDEYYRVGVIEARGQASKNLMRSRFEGEDIEKVCTLI